MFRVDLSLAAVFFCATACGFADEYEGPPGVLVGQKRTGFIDVDKDIGVTDYVLRGGLKEITLNVVRSVVVSGTKMTKRVSKEEVTSYHPLCVSPLGPDKLFVVGVNDLGETIIERWRINTVTTMGGDVFINTTKSFLFSSPALTHIRCFAVAPDESFILAMGFEDPDVKKIDLATGMSTVVLDDAVRPGLNTYWSIARKQHIVNGHVWIVAGQLPYVDNGGHPFALMLWDDDLDTVPSLVDPVADFQEWGNRGYLENRSFKPDADWWNEPWDD